MKTAAKTLSVVVPVRNAERTLTACVLDLLDVLGDFSARFEVLIVDDGSTDQTDEVAYDLSQRYPQVGVTRHAKPRGIEASVETGVARTSGDVVIVHAGRTPVNTKALRRTWQHRDQERLVIARSEGHPGVVDRELLDGLANWGQRLSAKSGETVRQPTRRPDGSKVQSLKRPPILAPFFRISDGTTTAPTSR